MTHRILLVEADPDLRSLLQDVLTDEGHDVVTAPLPVVEPAHVAALGLDAIVLEYSVGRQAQARRMLDQMQACSATTAIPVIISTTVTKAADELAGLLRPSSDALLPKPFTIDDLLETVERVAARWP